MNLRAEFDSILKQYGTNVYLNRCLNPFGCNEKPRWNTADEIKLEKHTVRSMNPTTSDGLVNIAQEQPEGVTHASEMIFWFKHDVNPGVMDRIYDKIPGFPNDQVLYEIDYVDPKLGINGRIEFWAIGATRTQPE